jgi:hypothetical protein
MEKQAKDPRRRGRLVAADCFRVHVDDVFSGRDRQAKLGIVRLRRGSFWRDLRLHVDLSNESPATFRARHDHDDRPGQQMLQAPTAVPSAHTSVTAQNAERAKAMITLCKECRYWDRRPAFELGHCRIRAPFLIDEKTGDARWPRTKPDDGCYQGVKRIPVIGEDSLMNDD